MRFHYGHLATKDQALEMGVAHALLTMASHGRVREAVRIYRPAAPTVAFGRRDTHLPGFPAAARAAAAAGFEPVVRPSGGRAVAYTSESVVVDHVKHDTGRLTTHDDRFREFGMAFVEALVNLGLDARLGAVDAEYCPGPYSVNARGRVKLVGTSQRVVRHAWLFSSLVVLGDRERLRSVLQEVYGELGLPFDPGCVGAVTDEMEDPSTGAAEQAVLECFDAARGDAKPLESEVLALAERLSDDNRIDLAFGRPVTEGSVRAG